MDEDAILRRLADLEEKVEELVEWKRKVEDKERLDYLRTILTIKNKVLVLTEEFEGHAPGIYCPTCFRDEGEFEPLNPHHENRADRIVKFQCSKCQSLF